MTSQDKRRPAPIDRGWAWVVMAAVMLSTFLEMGIYKSFGIFFVEYIEKFGSSATMTSVISGIYLAGYSVFDNWSAHGLVKALVMMTYGLGRISSRQSVMIGGVFLSIGYFLSSLATTIEVVFVAQGVFTAIGSACIHGPSIVILSKYFNKRRGLSNSLAVSCGSLGGLVLPILFYKLVEIYNLEGALMITSGIVFNCSVAGSLMRPIDQYLLESNDPFIKDTGNCHEKREMIDSSKISLQRSEQNIEFRGSREVTRRKTDISEFSGSCISLTNLPNSTVKIEFQHDETDEKTSKCGLKYDILSNVFDCTLLKNTMFVLLLIAGCLGQIECALAHIFIPPYAKEQGIADGDIPFIAGTIGIAEFTGRCITGMLADVQCVERYVLISASLIITGTVTQFVHFYDSVWTFVLFSVLYGIFSGVLIALYSPVCADLLGVDRIRKTYGLSCCFTGISISVSAPLFGLLRDITGSYVLSFHVMGSCALIGGLSLVLIPWAKSYEEKKLEKMKAAQSTSLL